MSKVHLISCVNVTVRPAVAAAWVTVWQYEIKADQVLDVHRRQALRRRCQGACVSINILFGKY